jgi:hypothetical protein
MIVIMIMTATSMMMMIVIVMTLFFMIFISIDNWLCNSTLELFKIYLQLVINRMFMHFLYVLMFVVVIIKTVIVIALFPILMNMSVRLILSNLILFLFIQ